MHVFSAATGRAAYTARSSTSGELVKARASDEPNAGDFQGYCSTLRRAKFKDPRVREALGLALRLRVDEPAALLRPVQARARLLRRQRLRGQGPARRRTSSRCWSRCAASCPRRCSARRAAAAVAPTPPGSLRENLRKARDLLAEAGWTYRDGALRNAKGEPFTLEYLDEQRGGDARRRRRTSRRLEKLGIQAELRARSDFALHPEAPGRVRLRHLHHAHSRAPKRRAASCSTCFGIEGGRHRGLEQPHRACTIPRSTRCVDAWSAPTTRPSWCARLRALDRVLRHGHYADPAVVRRAPTASPTAPGSSSCPSADAAVLPRPRTGS